MSKTRIYAGPAGESHVETEASDGMRRSLNTGNILLAEGTHGRGHISRVIDGQPVNQYSSPSNSKTTTACLRVITDKQ
jgi:hypothetical protein